LRSYCCIRNHCPLFCLTPSHFRDAVPHVLGGEWPQWPPFSEQQQEERGFRVGPDLSMGRNETQSNISDVAGPTSSRLIVSRHHSLFFFATPRKRKKKRKSEVPRSQRRRGDSGSTNHQGNNKPGGGGGGGGAEMGSPLGGWPSYNPRNFSQLVPADPSSQPSVGQHFLPPLCRSRLRYTVPSVSVVPDDCA
jgi:hypothetical protein